MNLHNFLTSGHVFEEHESQLMFRFRVLNLFMIIAVIFSYLIGALGDLGIMQIGNIQPKVDYIFATCTLFLIWSLRKSRNRYYTVAWMQIVISQLTFISALYSVSTDEFRIIWLFVGIYISYILLGVSTGVVITIMSMAAIVYGHLFMELNITETAIYTAMFSMVATSLMFRTYSLQIAEYEGRLRKQNKKLADNVLKLDAALEQANVASKTKSLFLANMSHEIRTPMNGVLGMVQVLNTTRLDEQQQYYLSSLERSGKTLLFLIDDLLDHSKIESGQLAIKIAPFDTWAWIEDIMMFVEPMFENSQVHLISEIDDNLPKTLIGDQVRLKQIVLNLIGNAAKFTDEGEVKFIIRCDNSENNNCRLHIEVQDSGIGIPGSKLQTIFEPFQQAAPERIENKGVGLGLSICNKIIQTMNGELSVTSREGQGSHFVVSIPLPVANESDKNCDREKIFIKKSRLDVLLVEDDKIGRLAVKTLLGAEGHNVTIAENGQKAIDLLKQNKFDLILMDVHMPVMNGENATRIIKQQKLTQAPIIGMTASVMNNERENYLAAGMDALIEKPFNFELLKREVNNLVT